MEIHIEESVVLLDLCPICLSSPTEITIPECSHQFCKSCLSQYTELKISDGQVLILPCPFTPCTINLDSDFMQSYLSSDYFYKYLVLHKKKSLEADIKFRWCPKKSCEGFDIQKSSNKLTCNICGYKFCFLCASAWHKSNKCILSDDSGFMKWSRIHNLKHCPKCRSRTVKNGGCPLMKCTKCQEDWCWRCGLSFSQHSDVNCLLVSNGFDIVWYWILLMISAPVTLPFWAGFWVLGLIIYNDILTDDSDNYMRIIMKNPWICTVIAFIVSPAAVVVVLVLGPILVSLFRALEMTPKRWSPIVTWYVFINNRCYSYDFFTFSNFFGLNNNRDSSYSCYWNHIGSFQNLLSAESPIIY